jgi:hypothetical protein
MEAIVANTTIVASSIFNGEKNTFKREYNEVYDLIF